MDNNSRVQQIFALFLLCVSLYVGVGDARVVSCIDTERLALLEFKEGLDDDHDLLSSWGSREDYDNKECCKWWGVKCSNRTGHVVVLDLRMAGSGGKLRGEVSHSLSHLQHLRHLDLSCNSLFGTQMGEVIGSLHRLKYLNLSHNGFTGEVPHHLGNLTSLHTLDLGFNGLATNNIEWLSQLRFLKLLDLSSVSLESVKNWVQVIFNLPFLQELHLSGCKLGSVLPSSSLRLLSSSSSKSLSVLDLSYNNLTSSSTYSWLFNVTKNLVSIDLRHNHFEGSIPEAFGEMISIERIDLSENSFRGGIPESFSNLTHLRSLDLSYNSLEGTVSEVHFSKLSNLKELSLSYNSLSFNVSSEWVPAFQLDVIRVANCSLGTHFPKWLQTQNNFSHVDLAFGGISDTLPNWFWDLSPRLTYLNLSHNFIGSDKLPPLSEKFHGDPLIDLSFNNFSSPILSIPPNVTTLLLSKNRFKGSASFLCGMTNDKCSSLDLSHNLFSGDLPSCWMNMKRLSILNLGKNNFSGQIPESLGLLSVVETLHLCNNFFIGEIPSSLKNCTRLRTLDIKGNKLTGNIPTWVGSHLTDLIFFSLRSNKLNGNIPQSICHLSQIQILDLSHNEISGKIPNCLNNLTSLVQKNITIGSVIYRCAGYNGRVYTSGGDYMDSVSVEWKRQDSEFKKILGYQKLVDLSSNKLDGQIPREIASLKALVSLNLSSNYLTGDIFEHIDEMEMLESLDLSRNHLSGEIPTGLAGLNYLSVLDLSYNNLSGQIPSGTQLQSFNASSYIENNGLCGLPLDKCPSDAIGPLPTDHENNNDKSEDEILTKEFYISIGIGFVVGLCGVYVILLKESCKNAYFRYAQNTSHWIYMTSCAYTARLRRKLSG